MVPQRNTRSAKLAAKPHVRAGVADSTGTRVMFVGSCHVMARHTSPRRPLCIALQSPC